MGAVGDRRRVPGDRPRRAAPPRRSAPSTQSSTVARPVALAGDDLRARLDTCPSRRVRRRRRDATFANVANGRASGSPITRYWYGPQTLWYIASAIEQPARSARGSTAPGTCAGSRTAPRPPRPSPPRPRRGTSCTSSGPRVPKCAPNDVRCSAIAPGSSRLLQLRPVEVRDARDEAERRRPSPQREDAVLLVLALRQDLGLSARGPEVRDGGRRTPARACPRARRRSRGGRRCRAGAWRRTRRPSRGTRDRLRPSCRAGPCTPSIAESRYRSTALSPGAPRTRETPAGLVVPEPRAYRQVRNGLASEPAPALRRRRRSPAEAGDVVPLAARTEVSLRESSVLHRSPPREASRLRAAIRRPSRPRSGRLARHRAPLVRASCVAFAAGGSPVGREVPTPRTGTPPSRRSGRSGPSGRSPRARRGWAPTPSRKSPIGITGSFGTPVRTTRFRRDLATVDVRVCDLQRVAATPRSRRRASTRARRPRTRGRRRRGSPGRVRTRAAEHRLRTSPSAPRAARRPRSRRTRASEVERCRR